MYIQRKTQNPSYLKGQISCFRHNRNFYANHVKNHFTLSLAMSKSNKVSAYKIINVENFAFFPTKQLQLREGSIIIYTQLEVRIYVIEEFWIHSLNINEVKIW